MIRTQVQDCKVSLTKLTDFFQTRVYILHISCKFSFTICKSPQTRTRKEVIRMMERKSYSLVKLFVQKVVIHFQNIGTGEEKTE